MEKATKIYKKESNRRVYDASMCTYEWSFVDKKKGNKFFGKWIVVENENKNREKIKKKKRNRREKS